MRGCVTPPSLMPMSRVLAAAGFAVVALLVMPALGRAATKISYDVSIQMKGGDAPSAQDPDAVSEPTGATTELETLHALLLGEASLTLQKDKKVATRRAVERRASADQELFEKLLRSRGFYQTSVTWASSQTVADDGDIHVDVVFDVEPGPVYRLTGYRIHELPEPATGIGEPKGIRRLKVKMGAPAAASMIVAADRNLVDALRALGYPFAEVANREVVVDHALRSMEVDLTVAAGARARYGDVEIVGNDSVATKFVNRRLTLPKGEYFNPADLDETQGVLLESGVFSSVNITYADAVDADGLLAMQIALVEGKPRTIGAGLRFSSAQGIGMKAYWEHRNILGAAEKLRVQGDWGTLGFALLNTYREPDFLDEDQSLLLEVELASDDTDAYQSDRLRTSAGIERPISDRLVAGYGLSFEQASETGETQNQDFTLVSTPLYLSYDSSNDLLDPVTGQRTVLSMTPYLDPLATETTFIALKLSERVYWGLDAEKRFVLAGRFTVGSISGAPLSAVPLSKRFYAGGADSVRGYDYQLVSPLDEVPNPDDPTGDPSFDPTGGLSMVQGGIELRYRFWENFGLAPFLEGASVTEDAVPDIGGDYLYAAGLGARYYTVAGPVRLDIAVPLNGRKGIDDSFEFYLSLGQSF